MVALGGRGVSYERGAPVQVIDPYMVTLLTRNRHPVGPLCVRSLSMSAGGRIRPPGLKVFLSTSGHLRGESGSQRQARKRSLTSSGPRGVRFLTTEKSL